MKKRMISVLAVFLVVLTLGMSPASAQTKPSPADRVSSLLLKFPAESAADRDAAAAELITLGPAAVTDLCGRLAAPGTADDSLVRFALDAVIVRAGRPGAESERTRVVAGILDSLDEIKDPEIQTFLLVLLQQAGKAEIVKPLVRFLRLPLLVGPVVRALTATKTPAAEAALIKALDGAGGDSAVAIIQGLAGLKSAAAVPKLLRLAEGTDPKLRVEALEALADIGDPVAFGVLERIRIAAPSEERAGAASRLLLLAGRMAESGLMSSASSIARSLLDNFTAPGEDHIRAAALTLYLGSVGEKAGLDTLLEAAVSPNPKYRQKALDLAAGLRTNWTASTWIDLLAQTPPDVQADLIRMFARRGETAALPTIREKLRSPDRFVRAAAAGAAVRLGGAAVWDDLVPLLKSSDEAEAKAAGSVIVQFPSDLLLPGIAGVLPEAPPVSQIILLGILADRKAKDHVGAVWALVSSPDEKVRAAALAALEQTVSEKDLPALIEGLMKAESAPEIVAWQNAQIAAVRQIPDVEFRAESLLKALEQTSGPKRIDFLRPLYKIGGAAALRVVLAETKNPDPQVQSVAVFTLANWPDAGAIEELLAMARNAPDRKSRYLALQGIARLVPASSGSRSVKLGILGEAMAAAVETDEKNVVLNGVAAIRTPEALAVVGKYMDDPALQARAAQAVARLVQPGIALKGLTGFESAVALKRAAAFIENETDRAQAERYAHDLLLGQGFVPLFNDKDLSGWKGLVADPPKRAAMSLAELAKAQAQADEDMRAHWRVVEGVLSFDGKGHSLCTRKDYGDFEMFVDWKIEPQGDSGLYLRGSPQVQIWDPAQWPEGSGGLYNNQKNPNKPAVKADRPVGEWNSFYIKMVGERVTVDLNGVRVVDNIPMENYWERDKPIYPSGQIELQAHSTPLLFKNLYLREIPAVGSPAEAPKDPEAGFVFLFNGKDLTGWTGGAGGYVVEDGTIAVLPGNGGNLYTDGEYADFHLKFEFKLTPGANNGIGIRTPATGDAAYVGMEIQVLDDSAEMYKDLKPYQYHGSIYGVVPAKRGFQKPVGEWNTEEIIARGRRITVILNGTTIVDADIDQASTPRTMDGRDHPGLKRAAGWISFCGHGSRVEFRNLRIKVL
jgi:HEAT repeat protein